MYIQHSRIKQIIKQPFGLSAFGASFTRVAPDFARVEFEIEQVSKEATDALESGRVKAQKMLQTLMASGVAADDIFILDIELNQKWDHSGSSKKLIGYSCETEFELIVREPGGLSFAH